MSTDTTPANNLFTRIANKLIDNGQITIAIVILGFISWIFWVRITEKEAQEQLDKQTLTKRMEKYESKYDNLEKYVREQFTPAIEKNNRILEDVSRRLDKNN